MKESGPKTTNTLIVSNNVFEPQTTQRGNDDGKLIKEEIKQEPKDIEEVKTEKFRADKVSPAERLETKERLETRVET